MWQLCAEVLDRLWYSPQGRGLRRALNAAAGLVLPVWCVGCHSEETDLCSSCAALARTMARTPFRAERTALALPILHDGEVPRVLPVTAAACYEGLIAELMLAYKDHEYIRLARVLAPALGRALQTGVAAARAEAGLDVGPGAGPGILPILLVPAPASLRSRVKRSYRPLMHLLGQAMRGQSRRAAAELEVADVLTMQGLSGAMPKAGQKSRGMKARRKELTGAFRLSSASWGAVYGRRCLLVDDVLTTGSTLKEMYRVLEEAGADVLGAVVLAAAPRPVSSEMEKL